MEPSAEPGVVLFAGLIDSSWYRSHLHHGAAVEPLRVCLHPRGAVRFGVTAEKSGGVEKELEPGVKERRIGKADQ